MATGKPSWTENVTLRTAATLASGSSTSNGDDDIDLDTLGADVSMVVVDALMGSSTEITVAVYLSWDSGTSYTSEPIIEFSITSDGEYPFLIADVPYASIVLTEASSAGATGNIAIHHCWRQWDIT